MEHLPTIPFGVDGSETADAFHDDERHIYTCFHHPLVYRIKEGTVGTNEHCQLGITGVVDDDPLLGDPRRIRRREKTGTRNPRESHKTKRTLVPIPPHRPRTPTSLGAH